jgi:hypothetical protein
MNAILLALILVPQETIAQDTVLEIDDRGDAQMTVEFRLSARTWLEWRERYGDHPDIVWRDLKHRFPMYELHDYRMEKDDVNRRAKATVKVRGAALHRTQGTYEFSVPKNWRKLTESPREWLFTSSEIAGPNVILQQTLKIVLPAAVPSSRLEPSEEGHSKIVFAVPMPARPSRLLWIVLTFGAFVGCLGTAGAGLVLRKA